MSAGRESSEATPSRSADAPDGHQKMAHTQDPSNYRREVHSIEEMRSAIENNRVSLSHIVRARHLSQQLNNPGASPEERATYDKLRGRLRASYGQAHPGMKAYHFCSYVPAAVTLSTYLDVHAISGLKRFVRGLFLRQVFKERSQIDMVYLPEASQTTDVEIEAAVWRSQHLYLEATQRRGIRRDVLVRAIYSLIVYLFSLADAEAMPDHDPKRVAKTTPEVQAEVNRLEQSMNDAAETEARHDYLLGMFIGMIFLVALVAVLFHFASGSQSIQLALGVAVAGGLGATVSVMSRLTANRLKVDAGAGTALIRFAGSFRLVVGAIFGLALYIFVAADLLPISLTVTGQKLIYFYLAIAFLAGFSERLAQDAITKAGGVINSGGSATEGSEETSTRSTVSK